MNFVQSKPKLPCQVTKTNLVVEHVQEKVLGPLKPVVDVSPASISGFHVAQSHKGLLCGAGLY